MDRPPYWPSGPNFHLAGLQRPPLPASPPALYPYEGWGAIHATTIWNDAGRCAGGCEAGVAPPGWGGTVAAMQRSPGITNPWALAWWMRSQGYQPHEAGQASDAAWYAELIADRHTPNVAKPYLERNEPPPEPGGRDYLEHVRPYFRYGPEQEQHYIDWWYQHFTSDAPGGRYTIPATPPPAEPAEAPPGPRPPRDWPAQEPAEPTFTPTEEPLVPVSTTSTPPTQSRPVPWGWVVGGSAVALLIGGGVAYAVTRPTKRRRKG